MSLAAYTPDKVLATVNVELGARSYPILIGRGLIEAAPSNLAAILPGVGKFAIVADAGIRPLAQRLEHSLRAHGKLAGEPCFVAPGEGSKSFAALERVVSALLDAGLERQHGVIALGGGVIGDLAGFAAAILKRGVPLVQVPTTLLAQVDSSVGGKTGINTRHGKNLAGAFHQPSLVLADLDAFATLPPREFRAGYAEVVKYGALGDAGFFAWLEQNRSAIFDLDTGALLKVVQTSCQMKADIVARDEFETGDRALLNLGHTFGHAVEAWAGYSGSVLHGEAVALGTVLAAEFSRQRGLCNGETPERLRTHIAACGFATGFGQLRRQMGSAPTADELFHFMQQDKKVRDGKMTFILMRGIGEAFVTRDVSPGDVREFLEVSIQSA